MRETVYELRVEGKTVARLCLPPGRRLKDLDTWLEVDERVEVVRRQELDRDRSHLIRRIVRRE